MRDNVARILAAIMALSEEDRHILFERLAGEMEFPSPSQTSLPLAFSTNEIEGPADYTVVFDGGSHGNPGPGYGSYALIQGSDGKQSVTRLDFGRQMTNNEAEYETLTAALQGLIERIETAGRSPADFSVEVRGDSALVIHQTTGQWKTKSERMRALRNRGRELLARFKGYRVILQEREESVKILGH